MTELPEEVARELQEYLSDSIPSYAVTVPQLTESTDLSETQWRRILKKKVDSGTWARERRKTTYYYWPVQDEGN